MPRRKMGFVIVTLAVALVAASLASPNRVQSGDPPANGRSTTPSAATEPKAGLVPVHRIFLEPLTRPTGEGNVRIRVGEGLARTVSLNLDHLKFDQKRYVENLDKAKRVVILNGRQQARHKAQAPPKGLALKLEPGREEELHPFVGLPELDPAEEQLLIKNCLMITDLNVVEDPERTTGTGPWTFGTLMTNLANRSATGIEPAEFVRRWLENWERDQFINSFTVPNRKDGIKKLVTDPWQEASGGAGKPLDLTKAPFRLLTIASRLDLRSNLVLGAERLGGGAAGEARFVFCAYDMKDANKPVLFTVIFEFQIKRKDFHDVREWAEQWYGLKNIPLGTTRYNKALQKITDQFAEAGTDPESPPNQSALSQLRTNEIELGLRMTPRVALWEIREFRIDVNNGGYLREVTAKQTPDRDFNDDPKNKKQLILAQYVNGSQADILANEHHVPVEFPSGKAFLGAAAPTPPNAFWNAPGIKNPEARHLFSLGTCSACHAGETFPKFVGDDLTLDQVPPHFTHVRPRMAGKEARLSPFLTGKDNSGNPYLAQDPVDQTKKRAFHDLSNRAQDLDGLVQYGVIYEKDRRPLQMVH